MEPSPTPFFKSPFIHHHYPHLLNLILSHTSFLLQGPRGCGKTTLIQHLLHESHLPYIKINSILGEKKHNFIRILWTQLKKLFRYDSTIQCVSFETLVRSMETLKQEAPSFHYTKALSQGVVYVFIDNIEELQVDQKFIETLLTLGQHLQINLSFIFCGVNFPKTTLIYQRPISHMINIIMPKPEKPFMKQLVMGHLKDGFLREVEKIIGKCKGLGEEMHPVWEELVIELEKGEGILGMFVNHIVEGFELIESDIEQVKNLSMTFKNKLIDKYEEVFDKYHPRNNSKSKTQKNEVEKIKIAKILNDPGFRSYFHRVCQHGSESAWSHSKKDPDATLEDFQSKKIFYPELIKASLCFAEVCHESEDHQRFKEQKRRNKKTFDPKNHHKFKVKKHNPFRIIAIAESLESQTRVETKEKRHPHHSMDYYTCFHHLVEEGNTRLYGKSGAFGIGKIQSKANEVEVEELLRDMDLKIEQYRG